MEIGPGENANHYLFLSTFEWISAIRYRLFLGAEGQVRGWHSPKRLRHVGKRRWAQRGAVGHSWINKQCFIGLWPPQPTFSYF